MALNLNNMDEGYFTKVHLLNPATYDYDEVRDLIAAGPSGGGGSGITTLLPQGGGISISGSGNTRTLTVDLQNYATTTAVNTLLANYTDTSGLTTLLAAYSNTATILTLLGSYTDTAALTLLLANYATNADVNTTLANYSLTNDINVLLANYSTTATINTLLATSLAYYKLTSSLFTSNNITAVRGLSQRKLNEPSLISKDLLRFSSINPPRTNANIKGGIGNL